ncbi:Conserved_hypothetical protein [Hexamita inflata]|uniref:Uncharacterized protein n=1 Tax=Hexamita inflata TaxID=28002 RepID=A0AA86QG30_9EUKA|nr:Conserved hypothetical protein [Hexamita inflata]
MQKIQQDSMYALINDVVLQHKTELTISSYYDFDMQNLQSLVQLTKLEIQHQKLNNFQLISKLINLEYLNMSRNYKHGSFDVVDITPLQYLVKLTYLNLDDCACFDSLQSISTLITLKVLNLSDNSIFNINPLKNLTNLTNLNLNNNNIIHISPLKKLVALQKLNLSYNRALLDITPLQYLTKLIELDLERCDIYEISALRPLVNLKTLRLGQNQIVILFPLLSLKQSGLENYGCTYTNKISEQSIHNQNLDLDFRFRYDDQRFPTEEDIVLANKMHIVDTTNILLRTRNSNQKNKTKTIQENRQKVNTIMQNLEQNYSLFSSNLAAAMQYLNVSESQQ